MRYIGAGLSRTGTYSLHRALQMLGLSSLHFAWERMEDIVVGKPGTSDYKRFDDVDAVFDLPTAYYFQELMKAYPEARVILTTRDEDTWWQSVQHHMNVARPLWPFLRPFYSREQRSSYYIRRLVYGSSRARESLYRAAFRRHNARVIELVPQEKLLVLDICGGEGWERLCPFLDFQIPEVEFPHESIRAPFG